MTHIGSAAAGKLPIATGAGKPVTFTTLTFPSTSTANEILYSPTTNTVGGLPSIARSVLTTNSTSVPTWVPLTNGQLIVGSTAGSPAAATLTAGAGITITNGSNSITIDATAGGFTWNNVTGTSATMAKENGYQSNNAGLVTLTMPSVASSTFGDTIIVAGLGAGGWKIQCVATQLIHFGSGVTAAAGSISSTNRYDSIELVCSSTTTEWFVVSAIGNLTVA